MWSVKNEAESFVSVAVTAAREQMLTVCNVPASAEPMLGSQTTWRHTDAVADNTTMLGGDGGKGGGRGAAPGG